jgi:hypothetical protein
VGETRRFRLTARISSGRPEAVRPVLEERFPHGSVRRDGEEFVVEAELVGPGAKELNRDLLSQLRRVEKRTRLRASWRDDTGTELHFFDYVLKRTVASPSA